MSQAFRRKHSDTVALTQHKEHRFHKLKKAKRDMLKKKAGLRRVFDKISKSLHRSSTFKGTVFFYEKSINDLLNTDIYQNPRLFKSKCDDLIQAIYNRLPKGVAATELDRAEKKQLSALCDYLMALIKRMVILSLCFVKAKKELFS